MNQKRKIKDTTLKYASRELLDIPYYPSINCTFFIGDTVRSYNSAFDSEKPFKNNFKQGVVIDIKDSVYPKSQLLVKWQFVNYFGNFYRFLLPDGRDTFFISTHSPHLVKVNKTQLSLAL